MPAKQGIHVFINNRVNMVAEGTVHMQITAELKAYWLTCFDLHM